MYSKQHKYVSDVKLDLTVVHWGIYQLVKGLVLQSTLGQDTVVTVA